MLAKTFIHTLALAAVFAFASVGTAAAACPGDSDTPSEPTGFCPGDQDTPSGPDSFCPGGGDEPSEPST